MKGINPWPQKSPPIAFHAVPVKLNVPREPSLKVLKPMLLIQQNAQIATLVWMFAPPVQPRLHN